MKRILYLNRNFYIYDKAIEQTLTSMGYDVLNFSLVPKYTILDRLKQLANYEQVERKLAKRQQEQLLEKLEKDKVVIDIVLVISGQNLCEETLKKLRRMYPNATFVWHIWDSIKKIKEYSVNHVYFDHVISFDMVEAEKYGLPCLPNFYIKEVKNNNKKYDISFIGTEHSLRMKLLKQLINQKDDNRIYVYLLNGGIKALKKYMYVWNNRKILRYLKLFPLEYSKTLEIMSLSRCILDLPYPEQTGLTTRPMEAIGVHAKLITTNSHVKDYDFYNPQNIYVIDMDNFKLPDKDFIKGEYVELPDEIKNEYNIIEWCRKLESYWNRNK